MICAVALFESVRSEFDLVLFGCGVLWALWFGLRSARRFGAEATVELPNSSVIEGPFKLALRIMVGNLWFLVGVIAGRFLPLVGGFAGGCCFGFLALVAYELRRTVVDERKGQMRFFCALPRRWRLAGETTAPTWYWAARSRSKLEGELR